MNRKLQKKALEFERRLEAGETKALTPEESRRASAALVKDLKELRERFAPK